MTDTMFDGDLTKKSTQTLAILTLKSTNFGIQVTSSTHSALTLDECLLTNVSCFCPDLGTSKCDAVQRWTLQSVVLHSEPSIPQDANCPRVCIFDPGIGL